MSYQRQGFLRCTKCKHEWEIIRRTGEMYPCPKCEGFKSNE